jgi:predicted transcriptional regulator
MPDNSIVETVSSNDISNVDDTRIITSVSTTDTRSARKRVSDLALEMATAKRPKQDIQMELAREKLQLDELDEKLKKEIEKYKIQHNKMKNLERLIDNKNKHIVDLRNMLNEYE